MTIRTVSLSDLRSNLAKTLDAVNGDDVLIVTRRSKQDKAIIDVDTLEDLLATNDPAYLKKIKAARKSKGYFSHDEIFAHRG